MRVSHRRALTTSYVQPLLSYSSLTTTARGSLPFTARGSLPNNPPTHRGRMASRGGGGARFDGSLLRWLSLSTLPGGLLGGQDGVLPRGMPSPETRGALLVGTARGALPFCSSRFSPLSPLPTSRVSQSTCRLHTDAPRRKDDLPQLSDQHHWRRMRGSSAHAR